MAGLTITSAENSNCFATDRERDGETENELLITFCVDTK